MSSLTSIRRARAGPAPAAILAAAALMLAACSPIDEVEFQPAFKGQFSTRKQPAEVTTVSEEELRKQGYVRIGRVIIRHLQDKSYATDSATACRKQAARKGGDLVRMRRANFSTTETQYVKHCTDYSSTVTRQYYCPPTAGASCYYRSVRHKTCIRWESLPVVHKVVTSEAEVWRLEPNLALQRRLGKDFLAAVARGDIQGVKGPLAKGVDPDSRDPKQRSALLIAASGGHFQIVKSLVEHGADLHAMTGEYRRTPLTAATARGDTRVSAFLLRRGARINQNQGSDGETALNVAARNGRVPVVKLLLERGADPDLASKRGFTPLIDAAHGGHLETARLLLDHGTDIEQGTKDDWTPLMAAARRGHTEVARLLLDRGAKPNARNDYGGMFADSSMEKFCCTALDVARAYEHIETAVLLKKYGAASGRKASARRSASARHKPSPGETPLITAAATGNLTLVKKWLAQGADPNAEIPDSKVTALIRAAQKGHTEIVRLLLDNGAEINHDTLTGSALVYASSSGHEETVYLLLNRGAPPNSKSVLGTTPLIFEADNGHSDNVRLLLKAGARVNAKGFKGESALIKAAKTGSQTIVRLLLEHAADPALKNAKGKTALDLAGERGHGEIVTLLQKAEGG